MKIPEILMPSLGSLTKYISLLTIGKGIVDKVVVQKLLNGVIKIIAATVVVAMLASALLLTALGGVYYALVSAFPIQEWVALLIVSLLVAAIIGFITYKIVDGIKKIASASSLLIQTSMPTSPLGPVSDIVNAFMQGIKHPKPRPEKGRKYPKAVNK